MDPRFHERIQRDLAQYEALVLAMKGHITSVALTRDWLHQRRSRRLSPDKQQDVSRHFDAASHCAVRIISLQLALNASRTLLDPADVERLEELHQTHEKLRADFYRLAEAFLSRFVSTEPHPTVPV